VRNPLRLAFALVLACLTLAAGACGGDGGPELSEESAAAVDLINAACAHWNSTIETRGEFPVPNFDAENPRVDELPLVGDYFAAGHPARDEMIAAIATLDVPGEIEPRFDALVAALTTAQENAKKQAAAAQAGDADAFVATLDDADASQQAIEDAADELGADECRA
jgi:hypothetical protein